MSIGIASIGLGLGGFLAGLALGGAGIAALGGSGGVKQMMVDLAEGLNAFNPSSMAAFASLLGAGALFGVVTGVAAPVGLAMMGGTMLGMTAIGLGLGGFLAGLALGGAGIDMLGGGRGVKDMLVNLAEGLNAFGGLDAGNLTKLALAIPAFGVGMLGFFGMQGIAGMVKSFSDGMKGVTDWIFGNKTGKTPMQQLSEDLKLFANINGDNLSKIGQGFKDLASGLLGFASLKDEDLARAKKAVEAGAVLTKSAPSTPSTSPPTPVKNEQDRLRTAQKAPGSGSSMSPTPAGKNSLLDMIAKGESEGAGGYNAMNQGTPGGGPVIGSGDSQKIINKKLTDMTVGEIMDRAANPTDDAKKRKDNGLIFAAGRYQIIPGTLKGLVKQGVVSRDDKFDEATQDKLGMALIQGTGALKLAAKGDYEGAQNAMAKTWASIPLATDVGDKKAGQSYYQKAGQNTAHAGLDVKGALMASSPSTGVTLASASTSMSDQRMAAMKPGGGNTTINAPTTNVAQNGGGGGGNNVNPYNTDMAKYLLATIT